MGDDVGTSYYAYPVTVPSNQNTLRSHKSTLSCGRSRSEKGDNNEMPTIIPTPILNSCPLSSQTFVVLTPHINPHHIGHHCMLTPGYVPTNNQYIPLWNRPHSAVPAVKGDHHINTHEDFTKTEKTPYTARQCLIVMAIVFIMAFGAAIFMAVHYGNGYSSL